MSTNPRFDLAGRTVIVTGGGKGIGKVYAQEFAKAGARVVAITAKDKLRRQLGKNLDFANGSMCFSSEKADKATKAENGIDDVLRFVGLPLPDMYSEELSLFVLDAGIKILERDKPDLMFLSLTDYVQHKYAPTEAEARSFYQDLDQRFGKLESLGAVVALTADHGMNDKSTTDGKPNVIWLQDVLDAKFGKGDLKVICPITDAFVAHHGALGGFVRVYCQGKTTPKQVMEALAGMPGLDAVYDKKTACRLLELPEDREGDVVVISDAGTCIGGAKEAHDLKGLEGHRLRTHGGISEAKVPFITSAPLNAEYRMKAGFATLKSYQVFEFAINGAAQ